MSHKLIGTIFLCFGLFLIGLYFFLNTQQYWSQTGPSIPSSETSQAQTFVPQAVTLEDIYNDDHSWTATLSAQSIRTMIATGDVMPARSVNTRVLKLDDFTWPFIYTAEVLKSSDITFINLETPLLENCPTTIEGMIFCGDIRNVEGLNFAGIDVVNIANNHAGNYGEKGIKSTIDILERNNLLVSGVNGPVYKKIRGLTFAFLGFTDIERHKGIAVADEEVIRNEIALASQNADIVVIEFHWGTEYTAQPNRQQIYLGRLSIDAGADLVIGNHPHWIQPVEIYKGKLITYAHGNFVFDQEWSLKTKQGVVGKYTFYEDRLIDVEFLPVLIKNYGQPSFLEGIQKHEILEDMKKQSELLHAKMQ